MNNNNNNNKTIAIVLGAVAALFALSLLMRFVLLSQYGVSGSWMYFGLPIGGIGLVVLLLRLGLVNFGDRSGGTIQPWHYNNGVQSPPPASPPPVTSAPQRLQELERMRAYGAISDAEYTAKRQQIISSI
jgi:hypothetical protein